MMSCCLPIRSQAKVAAQQLPVNWLLQKADGMFPEGQGRPRAFAKDGAAAETTNELLENVVLAVRGRPRPTHAVSLCHVYGRCAAGCCRCRRRAARASRPRRPRLSPPCLPRWRRSQRRRSVGAARRADRQRPPGGP